MPTMDKVTKPHKMTGWYDPVQLIQTGIRVASATVFGSMFDRREIMSSLDPFDLNDFNTNYDFSNVSSDFWLDYCADLGDGWNPTYAVARLLARPAITLMSADGKSETVMRPEVLVLGGDQVYPTASKEDYERKLQAPFAAANLRETGNETLPRTHLFSVPGNHDWYDGLTAFARMFCNRHPFRIGSAASPGRQVGGRRTHQSRSYFALKLPHKWWLCAFDIQLDGYLDQTQLSYFEYVAQELMEDGCNIILCVGQPVWSYSRSEGVREYENFLFASLVVTGAFPRVDGKATKRHNLRVVLTGDAHHYARFAQTHEGSSEQIDYITCGLGGAFLHPTHWLQSTQVMTAWEAPPPLPKKSVGTLPNGKPAYSHDYVLEKIYPERSRSWLMTLKNIGFVYFNPKFAAFFGAVGLFVTWLLHFSAVVFNTTLIDILRASPVRDALWGFLQLLLLNPWPALVILGIFGALIYFADYSRWPKRIALGTFHAAVQILVYCVALFVIARLAPASWGDLEIIVATSIATGLLTPTVMGLYLLFALNVLSVHWNEAFSSLRMENHKGFLRFKIDQQGRLTVYPIVLDTVPSDDSELSPRLIEKPFDLPRRPKRAVLADTNGGRTPGPERR